MEITISTIIESLNRYSIQLSLSMVFLVLFFLLHGNIIPRLESYVEKGALKNQALRKAIYTFRLLYGVILLAIILFIWGFNFEILLAISSGIIAITGVALFASWSILSNITSFFILLAHESFKRGTFIRIIEGDNYVEGVISDINLFNTRLITENREYIIYPNNLLIARPTVINPKVHYTTIGKIHEFLPAPKTSSPE